MRGNARINTYPFRLENRRRGARFPSSILRTDLLLVIRLREREVAELRRALVGLNHRVVRILAAEPIADAQRAVGIRHVLVCLAHEPRLDDRLGVVDPDVDDDSALVYFVPDLDRVELLGI